MNSCEEIMELPGLKSLPRATMPPAVQDLPRRGVAPEAQEEGDAGQQHAGGIGGGDGGDLVVADGDQVLGRDGAQPGGQLGGVVGGELVGVHLDLEAHGGGPAQVVFGLRVGEITLLAKNIDELGQALFLHPGQDVVASRCSRKSRLRPRNSSGISWAPMKVGTMATGWRPASACSARSCFSSVSRSRP